MVAGAKSTYLNGQVLTEQAGKPGVRWNYLDGQPLTHQVGVPGAAYFYFNRKPLSQSFGKAGASWQYSDGTIVTQNGPDLTPLEMAKIACEMITGQFNPDRYLPSNGKDE